MIGAATKSRFMRALAHEATRVGVDDLPRPEELVRFVHGRFTNQLSALGSFVTFLFARFDLGNRELTTINCGHPPAIHYRQKENRIELIESRHSPFGFNPDEEYLQQSTGFSSGDTFLFLSDGLTEARTPSGEQFGIERVVEIVERTGSIAPSDLVELIKTEVARFSHTQQVTDDLTCIAVLIQTAEAGRIGDRETVETSTDLAELASIRDRIRRFCLEGPERLLDDNRLGELTLAVTEVASNIIRHSYHGRTDGLIHTTLEAYEDRITIRLRHFGESLKSTLIPPALPEETATGGRGLFIIDRTVDSVVYSQEEDGSNAVTLMKKRGD